MALRAGELYATLELDSSRFDSSFNRVRNNTDSGLSDATGKANRSFLNMSKIADGAMMAIGMGITKVVAKVGELAINVVNTGIAFNAMKEQSEIAWGTLLGSAEKAKETIETIQKLGAKTPFQFEDLDKASKKLFMAKFEGKDLERTLVAVGDAVSAVGAGTEGLDSVSSALYKISAKGKASAEEMNMLAERGIPAWDILAETMGKSVPELMKMSEKGELLAKDVLPALVDGFEKKFGGAMEKQSASFNGLISTMKDNFEVLAGTIMGGVFDYLKGILPSVIGVLEKLNTMFQDGTMTNYFNTFKSGVQEMWNIVSPVVMPIINMFKELGDMIIGTFMELYNDGTLSAFIENVKGLFETLCNILGPIMNVIKDLVVNTWAKAKELIMPLVKDIVAFIGEATQMLKDFWEKHGNQIMAIVNFVFGIIQTVINTVMWFIVTVISNCWENIKGMFSGALEFIGGLLDFFTNLFTGNWSALWENIKSMVSGAFQFIWNLINFILNINILQSIGNFAKAGVEMISGWVGGIKNWFLNLGSSVTTTVNNMINGVINFFSSMWTNTGSIITNMKNFIVNIFTYVKDALWGIISNIVNFFVGGFNNIMGTVSNIGGAISNIATTIKDGIMNVISQCWNWGKDIVSGIANGIKDSVGSVFSAIGNVASGIKDKFCNLLGINSPSKVFTQYGQWTSEGLAIGVGDNMDMIQDSADQMAMAIQPDFKNIEAPMPTSDIMDTSVNGAGSGGDGSPFSLNIANFNNNRNMDIEVLATEIAYYLQNKNLGMGVR